MTLVCGNGKAPWLRFPWPLACLSLASACLSQLYLLQSLSRFLKIGQLVRNYPVPTEYDREEAWRSRIVAEKAGAFLRSRAVRVTFRGSNCMVYVTAPPKALAQTRKEPRIPAILQYGPAAGGS
jgi:hypothetical protein